MARTLHLIDYRSGDHGHALAELWNASFDRYKVASDRLQQLLNTPNGAHVVAVSYDGAMTNLKIPKLIGFATSFSFDNSGGYLSCICVSPQNRRQGIGSRLVKEACEKLWLRGCSNIHVGSVFPRFWCGIPTDLGRGAEALLIKCGFSKCTDVLAKDLYLDLEGYDPPKDILFKAAREGLRFAPWSSLDYQECMHRQRANFDNSAWIAAYETLAANGLWRQVMVAFKSDGTQVGWALMIEPDLPVWNDLAFPCLVGEKTALIACVGVDAQARKRGVGHGLVVHALQDLRSRGMDHVFVDWVVLTDWYERLGFHIWQCYSQYQLRSRSDM